MQDLETIANRIRGDPYTLKAMGLFDKSETEKKTYIMTRKCYDGEQKANMSYINIYYSPSRKSINTSFLDNVVQIDVLVPYAKSNTAQMICDQLEALFQDWKCNGKFVDTDCAPYDNSTGTSWYTASMRLNFFKAKGTPILKQ